MIERELLVLRAMRGNLGPDPEGRLLKKPLEAVRKALDDKILGIRDEPAKETQETDSFCPLNLSSESNCPMATKANFVSIETCKAESFLSFLKYLNICPIDLPIKL